MWLRPFESLGSWVFSQASNLGESHMDWTAFAAVASVCGTIGLGILSFVRGSKADRALNTATTVQSTFTAQKELVDNLQEETTRLQKDLHEHRQLIFQCEDQCRECKTNLASAHRIIALQEIEIEKLKEVVTKHEKTINSMSRRTDSQSDVGDEERRKS